MLQQNYSLTPLNRKMKDTSRLVKSNSATRLFSIHADIIALQHTEGDSQNAPRLVHHINYFDQRFGVEQGHTN